MDVATLAGIKRTSKIPELRPGDTVKVHVKVVEGEKQRIQVFQGVVIGIKRGPTGSFTVRRVAYNVGTERVFPFNSPMVDKVEVLRHAKVRRAKLFYLRGLTAKKARLKEKREVTASGKKEAVTTVSEATEDLMPTIETSEISPTEQYNIGATTQEQTGQTKE